MIYSFSKNFPLRSIHFCMRLHQLSKHFCHSETCILNASTASSGMEKRWPLMIFFKYANKKKSFDVLMRLFVPMCESSHCRREEWSVFGGLFSWFLGRQLANKCLCTTQNWLFCVILVVRLRHVQFFRKNRRSFAWKSFVCEQVFLHLAHLETSIQ